jgi:UDP-glucose 4-epimerase
MRASPVCLVTGCAGFVGRHIARCFADAGYAVVGVGHGPGAGGACGVGQFVTSDLNVDVVAGVCRYHQPTVCVHAAGPASVRGSMEDPAGDFRRSIEPWLAVLEGVRQAAPTCHVILLSSAAVYGLPEVDPVDESQPRRPVSPYGYHKCTCEALAEEYSRVHGLRVSVVRLFNVYGAGQRHRLLWDLCRKLGESTDEVVELFGRGDEARDFIHVSDVAGAILRIAEAHSRPPTVYNVGSGRSVTVRDFARGILQHWPSGFTVRFNGKVLAPGAARIRADITRLVELGFEGGVALETGVADYVDWFCSLPARALQRANEPTAAVKA